MWSYCEANFKTTHCTNFHQTCTGLNNANNNREGNPDISGIGVVAAFGLTSLITIVFAMPIMLVSFYDMLYIRDGRITRTIKRTLGIDTKEKKLKSEQKLLKFLVHITLGLSDQQLFTGILILATGYAKHCTLSARHFWVIFDLSFFSSVTHLASLSALRRYLSFHRRLRNLRVLLMVANYVALLVAAIYTFRNFNSDMHDCYINCVFEMSFDLPGSALYTSQMVLLTVAFFWQFIMLYTDADLWGWRHQMLIRIRVDDTQMESLHHILEARRSRIERAAKSESSSLMNLIRLRTPRQAFYSQLIRLHQKFAHSKVYRGLQWVLVCILAPPAPFVWLLLLTLWGVGVARLVKDMEGTQPGEQEWGFGQLLPLLLVVLPFMTLTEAYEETTIQKRPSATTGDSEPKDREPRSSVAFDRWLPAQNSWRYEAGGSDQETLANNSGQMLPVSTVENQNHVVDLADASAHNEPQVSDDIRSVSQELSTAELGESHLAIDALSPQTEKSEPSAAHRSQTY